MTRLACLACFWCGLRPRIVWSTSRNCCPPWAQALSSRCFRAQAFGMARSEVGGSRSFHLPRQDSKCSWRTRNCEMCTPLCTLLHRKSDDDRIAGRFATLAINSLCHGPCLRPLNPKANPKPLISVPIKGPIWEFPKKLKPL